MLRMSIIIALFVSLFAIARGIEVSVRQGEVPSVALRTQKKAPASAVRERVAYYPLAPDNMPDLMDGYLFNPERLLEEDDEVVPEEKENMTQAAAIDDFEQVQYSGSIIMENQRLALIKFPQAPLKVAKKRIRPGQRRLTRKKTSKAARGLQNVQVKQGEIFKGFKVAEIAPERIVFERGADKIIKYLYDKNKKRAGGKSKVVPRSPAVPAVGRRRATTTKSKVQIPGRVRPLVPKAQQKLPSRVPRRSFNRTKRPTASSKGLYEMLERHPDLMAPPK